MTKKALVLIAAILTSTAAFAGAPADESPAGPSGMAADATADIAGADRAKEMQEGKEAPATGGSASGAPAYVAPADDAGCD